MPEQIALARKRNISANFFVGDLTSLSQKNSIFDAVFIFGVIHHIPQWKKALSEVTRVLKSGGCLLLEEPLHMFSREELEAGLKHVGLRIVNRKSFLFGYFRSYLCIKDYMLN